MDVINFTVLEDGTITVETESISQVNHVSADQLLETVQKLAGGSVNESKKEHAFWKNKAVQKGGKIVKLNSK